MALSKHTPVRPAAIREFLDVPDSWPVATALSRGACIVSDERSNPNKTTHAKVPDAARSLGIQCIIGWQFSFVFYAASGGAGSISSSVPRRDPRRSVVYFGGGCLSLVFQGKWKGEVCVQRAQLFLSVFRGVGGLEGVA